jgi:hypothetical protein
MVFHRKGAKNAKGIVWVVDGMAEIYAGSALAAISVSLYHGVIRG